MCCQPFTDTGELNDVQVHEHDISAQPMEMGVVHHMAEKGLATVSLSHLLNKYDVTISSSLTDDSSVRRMVQEFWSSPQGTALLHQRFGDGAMNDDVSYVALPTHVTRRRAPPDHLSLVHIDYPHDITLPDLLCEWQSRWSSILPMDDLLQLPTQQESFVGVMTLWIVLSDDVVTNYPLWVADASTVPATACYPYKVGGRRTSVGISNHHHLQFYTVPGMQYGDAWVFDTCRSPHVAVNTPWTGGNNSGVRESMEIRSLILRVCNRASS